MHIICVRFHVFLLTASFLFFGIGTPITIVSAENGEVSADEAYDMHKQLYIEDRFPSAHKCSTCHPKHFKEWAMSQHSYAQISPIFNSFQSAILELTSGTSGDFCLRCHTAVGTAMEEEIAQDNTTRHSVTLEGITCITCHRTPDAFGYVSARFPVEEGDVFNPVYGPTGNEEVQKIVSEKEKYRVATTDTDNGQVIHTEARRFYQLTTSGFCSSCHDVRAPNGYRLEDAFSEYKASPAAEEGISCQDCHMATIPGVPSEYEHGPAANVGGVETRDRKLTNHTFPGPDYSVVHPGIFPHNLDVKEFASIEQWLQFDYEAGWGTDEFEDEVEDDSQFPEFWQSIDDRYDARYLIDQQLETLAEVKELRKQILRNGVKIGDVITEYANSEKGIKFEVEVSNTTTGHGVPTGFDVERVFYLQVTVTDRNGDVVFKSGDMDPNGDLRDLHSHYVHDGELPLDEYLFSLQSKNVVQNIRGGERESVLPINFSPDPLPYIRPSAMGVSLFRHPLGLRKHKKVLMPNETRLAGYKVEAGALTGEGPYKADIKFISGMVPVNLVLEIEDKGFDYGMTTKDIVKNLVKGYVVLWEKDVTFNFDTPAMAESTDNTTKKMSMAASHQ